MQPITAALYGGTIADVRKDDIDAIGRQVIHTCAGPVQYADTFVAFKQLGNEVAADEPRTAGDEDHSHTREAGCRLAGEGGERVAHLRESGLQEEARLPAEAFAPRMKKFGSVVFITFAPKLWPLTPSIGFPSSTWPMAACACVAGHSSTSSSR